jgi:hypothetical protein
VNAAVETSCKAGVGCGDPLLKCIPAEAAKFVALWSGLVNGPGAAQNTRYLAIQMAGRARRYNRPDYMANAMALCAHYGFSVEDVISSYKVLEPIPSKIDEYPAAMAAMLRASSGYACGRCVACGLATSVTNASFEAAVMCKVDLDTAATDEATACCDLFGWGRSAYIHAHDVESVSRLIAQLYSMEQAADAVSVADAPSLVRIADRAMQCHVPCSARGMIKFGARPRPRGGRTRWLALARAIARSVQCYQLARASLLACAVHPPIHSPPRLVPSGSRAL